MVRFKENSFIIEIPAEMGVVEEWEYTQRQLIELLECVDRTKTKTEFDSIFNLIRCMIPSIEVRNQLIASN